jgi:hypothetical protein
MWTTIPPTAKIVKMVIYTTSTDVQTNNDVSDWSGNIWLKSIINDFSIAEWSPNHGYSGRVRNYTNGVNNGKYSYRLLGPRGVSTSTYTSYAWFK